MKLLLCFRLFLLALATLCAITSICFTFHNVYRGIEYGINGAQALTCKLDHKDTGSSLSITYNVTVIDLGAHTTFIIQYDSITAFKKDWLYYQINNNYICYEINHQFNWSNNQPPYFQKAAFNFIWFLIFTNIFVILLKDCKCTYA